MRHLLCRGLAPLIMVITLINVVGCSEDPVTQDKDQGWTINDPCQGRMPCPDMKIDLPPADMEQDQAFPAPSGMALIPEGSFMMGTSAEVNPNNYFFGEAPVHEVYLSAYAIDIYEVRVKDYQRCVDQGDCSPPKTPDQFAEQCNWGVTERAEHPINCIDWFQAKAYCEWAGKSLPTEAQWEKAARGPDSTIYPWGNEPRPSCDFGVLIGEDIEPGCGAGSTWPMGSRPKGSSIYGVMDLIGNVAEWTSDYYAKDYYGTESKDPQGPAEGLWHVPRGGHFIESIPYSSQRSDPKLPTDFEPTLGVRCAKNL